MHGVIKAAVRRTERFLEDPFDPPVEILRPVRAVGPFVLASPHSGRIYPVEFIAETRLDSLTLRASEDAYVDELFGAAPRLGAPLLIARFPRAYLDPNREPWELDPTMFSGPLPVWANTRTPRVAAGLGAIPRIVADGAEIYGEQLPAQEAERRVRMLHLPYHRALSRLIEETRLRFGEAILLDCHSMPSTAVLTGERGRGRGGRVDIVLGDRYGASAAGGLARFVERALADLGFTVARNALYAGGYSTERYGRPERGVHAIQIELSRALYLNEPRIERGPDYETVRAAMTAFLTRLLSADWRVLVT